MGLKRWVKHIIFPSTVGIDAFKNMIDEGSFVEGIKKSFKQEYCEDNPLTTPIYKAGKYDGKIDGYSEASDEYEKKLLDQADKFTKEKNTFQSERDEYERLLDEYEKIIKKLQEKANKSEKDIKFLNALLIKERELKKLRE